MSFGVVFAGVISFLTFAHMKFFRGKLAFSPAVSSISYCPFHNSHYVVAYFVNRGRASCHSSSVSRFPAVCDEISVLSTLASADVEIVEVVVD